MSSSSRSHALARRKSSACARVGRLADDGGRHLAAVGHQRAQAQPRELLVVDEQNVVRASLTTAPRVARGTRRPSWRVSNCAAMSCIRCSRSRTFFSAMPLPGPRGLGRHGVGDHHLRATEPDARADAHRAALGRRLDAMAHRVLDQRLQDQRRHARTAGLRVELPLDVQPLAEAHLLDGEVAPRQLDLLGQRDRFADVGRARRGTARPGPPARPRPAPGRRAPAPARCSAC